MYAPKKESSGGDFESHPVGGYPLVCTRVIDKGTVFNEQKGKDQRKVSIYFESAGLMKEGDYAGQPFLVIANFNYSMYQNSMLCKFIEAWRGKKFATQDEADQFDLEKLLRQPVFASIVQNDKWTNIESPMPIPNGMTPPTPVGDVYAFDADNMDMAIYEKLSDRMKENIQKSYEWRNPMSNPSLPKASEQPQRAAPVVEEGFDDSDILF